MCSKNKNKIKTQLKLFLTKDEKIFFSLTEMRSQHIKQQ